MNIVVAGIFHAMSGAFRRRPEASVEQRSQESDTESAGSRSPNVLVVSAFALMFRGLVLVLHNFIRIAIYGLLFCISILWLLLVAPPLYFVTLVSGAPARISLRHSRGHSLMVREAGIWRFETELVHELDPTENKSPTEFGDISEQIKDLESRIAEVKTKHRKKGLSLSKVREAEAELEKLKKHLHRTAIDVTLSQKPVSLTSVITSLLLWLANPIVAKIVA